MALRHRRLAGAVHGYVRRPETLEAVQKAGAVDEVSLDLAEVLRGAELVVLCTPLSQMAPLVARFPGALARGAVVTDVGSVKTSVVASLEGPVAAAGGSFVGSHPMAGSERSGVEAARADLFEGAVSVVTPTFAGDAGAGIQVVQLWEALGSRVVTLAPELHDELVSRSSHLPHLVAATLARFILSPSHPLEQRQLCAAGFRDTTRVASGSPGMWRDIALANREAILAALDGFQHGLGELRAELEKCDGEAIEAFLGVAKERRDGWIGEGGKSDTE
ncbi:MAG: prephenate dehydrogenase/arogenate dehydrogenase family protein [Verrucomicrobiales bacterium]|nr:prephenate dehydrogenase/arogenate dehydrogenase family protein [Verrucomicrobiales bacterium]